MLHINHDIKYFWYQDVMDFRNGFGGLSGLNGEHIRKEVTDGGVFEYSDVNPATIPLQTLPPIPAQTRPIFFGQALISD